MRRRRKLQDFESSKRRQLIDNLKLMQLEQREQWRKRKDKPERRRKEKLNFLFKGRIDFTIEIKNLLRPEDFKLLKRRDFFSIKQYRTEMSSKGLLRIKKSSEILKSRL